MRRASPGRSPGHRVAALISTVTEDYERVNIHGVRTTLLERQAHSLGVPLQWVRLSKDATNEEYEAKLGEVLLGYRQQGVGSVVFGDLFLEDIRAYREQVLASIGMGALFPLWKRDTQEFLESFLRLGFEAVVTCVAADKLGGSFAGRMVDEGFLASLPAGVDPCGENGEFHTFVFDGPGFRRRVGFELGEVVLRDGHYYRDLLPRRQ